MVIQADFIHCVSWLQKVKITGVILEPGCYSKSFKCICYSDKILNWHPFPKETIWITAKIRLFLTFTQLISMITFWVDSPFHR